MTNRQKNIKNSIVLIGPCGVGKSLIAETLAKKKKIPKLDIDDLMFMIEIDMRKILSPDKKHQEKFIHDQLEELREIKRDPALTEEELKHEELLVHDFVDLYNYFKATQQYTTDLNEVYWHNKLAMELINMVLVWMGLFMKKSQELMETFITKRHKLQSMNMALMQI